MRKRIPEREETDAQWKRSTARLAGGLLLFPEKVRALRQIARDGIDEPLRMKRGAARMTSSYALKSPLSRDNLDENGSDNQSLKWQPIAT